MSETWMIGPELTPALLRAKARYDAGLVTELEAAIEQMEAALLSCPAPALREMTEVLKAWNAGDEAAFRAFFGQPPTARMRALRRRKGKRS